MTPRHARHRMTLSLRRRIILPVLTLLAALALAAGLISGLSPASAAPAAAVTLLADRAAEFPAAVLAPVQDKTLIIRAVLRARAQAAARAAMLAAHTYTVRPGNTMSSVAARRCGTARDWTGIYAASRARHWTARNANVLTAGQHLYLSCAYLPSMLQYAPAPPPPPRPVYRAVNAISSSSGTYHRAYSAPAAVYHGGSGYQACVIARESGGNSQVMNSSGHYGLYQFDYGTWVSGGGSGGTFGHASVAEQNRVFAAVYAARGTQPWSPSDGC